MTGMAMVINDDIPGKVIVQMATYPGLPGGSGAIVNIIFKIADDAPAGSTPLTFDEAQLYDEDGNDIPTTSSPNIVDILPSDGGKIVSASSASGYPGEQVPIDISIDDWTGIAGGGITLTYDDTKLELVSALQDLDFKMTGMAMVINDDIPGKVIVQMATYPGLPGGSGAIVNIIFKIKEDAPLGITIPLPFDEAQLYDEDGNNIPTTSTPGEIIIPGGVTVVVSPKTASVTVNGTQQFTATVTGTTNTAVTWFVNDIAGGNSTVGTIDVSGLYHAPAVIPSPYTVTVKAVSVADPTKFDTASVTIIGELVKVSLTAPTKVSFEQNITAEVVVTQVNNLDTARINLAFDINVVEFQKVDLTGTLTEGASLVVNDTTPGELIVIINLPGVSGVSGAGTIAKVIFKPKAAGTSTTLTLSDIMLGDINAKEIPSEIVVPEVTVEITSIPGDADGDGDVDILDITKAERIVVGLDQIPPGGNPDCNEDGKVLPNDITCIEYKAAELPIPTAAQASRGEFARLRLITHVVGKKILKAAIYTSGVNNLDIAYFALTFNPEVLQLTDVSSGKLTSDANPTANIDNTSGIIRFVLNLPGVTGVSGSGTLAELTFKIVKKIDVSEDLVLSDVFLGDTSGRQINHIIK
jgi:hypothetical protein